MALFFSAVLFDGLSERRAGCHRERSEAIFMYPARGDCFARPAMSGTECGLPTDAVDYRASIGRHDVSAGV
jgi:hypothetical protein